MLLQLMISGFHQFLVHTDTHIDKQTDARHYLVDSRGAMQVKYESD